METIEFSSRITYAILELIKIRRSLILIVSGTLFITTIWALGSFWESSILIWSFALALPFKVIFIVVAFLLAFLIHRLAWHIAGALLYSSLWSRVFLWSSKRLQSNCFKIEVAEVGLWAERQQTIQHLIASTISVTAFVVRLCSV
jgi:hypothetical protein